MAATATAQTPVGWLAQLKAAAKRADSSKVGFIDQLYHPADPAYAQHLLEILQRGGDPSVAVDVETAERKAYTLALLVREIILPTKFPAPLAPAASFAQRKTYLEALKAVKFPLNSVKVLDKAGVIYKSTPHPELRAEADRINPARSALVQQLYHPNDPQLDRELSTIRNCATNVAYSVDVEIYEYRRMMIMAVDKRRAKVVTPIPPPVDPLASLTARTLYLAELKAVKLTSVAAAATTAVPTWAPVDNLAVLVSAASVASLTTLRAEAPATQGEKRVPPQDSSEACDTTDPKRQRVSSA